MDGFMQEGHNPPHKRCYGEYWAGNQDAEQGRSYPNPQHFPSANVAASPMLNVATRDFATLEPLQEWSAVNSFCSTAPCSAWQPVYPPQPYYFPPNHFVQQYGVGIMQQQSLPMPDAGFLNVQSHNLYPQGQDYIQQHNMNWNPQQLPESIPDTQAQSEPSFAIVGTDLVCFGMVTGLGALCQLSLCSSLLSYPVNFTDNEHFTGIEHSDLKGKLSSELTYITIALRGDDALELEVNCSMPDNSDSSAPKGQLRRRPGLSTQCSLDIIIYGPMELFDDIGSFFEEYDIYLQDPVNCKRNVRYCNPQRLSVDPSAVKFTSELGSQVAHAVVINDLETRPEFLDILCSQQDLAETAQPGPIRTVLRRHQKQALTFMLQRENGWAWDGCRVDIWEVGDSGKGTYFRNTISGAYQMQEPDQFYGGIVADPMGLGKSLSMIALIACDVHPHDNDPSSRPAVDREESSGQTLVIVPPPLLSTWEGQLKEHVFTNNLPWRRYHGKGRLRDSSELSDTLIVLTTYHTVMTEWRSVEERNQSILFKTKWKRIILDEAHFIRNSESQMSRAICSLESVSRWAVTGTPIQNKLGDLSALLKFLRISPYSEKRAFDADISNLWKSGNIDKAVERLKRLSSCLLLRRPKETIQLPTKHDYTYTVEFTTAERQLYEDVRSQAIAHIDEALHLRDSSTRSHSFFNVLQRIEAMRMVCNLGLHYPSRHEVLSGRQNTEDDWQVEAQRVFNLQRDMGQIQCQDCGFSADAAGDPFFESGRPRVSHLFSRCLKFLCSSCSLHYSDPNRIVLCEHNNPRCPISTVLMDVDSEEPPSSLPGSLIHRLPSKVEMLLDDLKKQPIDVKSVVFSSWKMTLNIVDAGLKNSSIPSLRYDGSVAQKDRQGVIDRFGNDPSIRVLLLTLTCGAVGLTLTEASRAYLMEPHWNPTLEDQALARIHRIGQTREVTTIRFSVQNSFEERIVELQDVKRDLARMLLNPQESSGRKSETSARELENLRRLI